GPPRLSGYQCLDNWLVPRYGPGEQGPVLPRKKGSYAEKVYLVPAVLRMNCSGISFEKATVASNPVQWAGTTKVGLIALRSATVLLITSGGALTRWKPPTTA